MFVFVWLCLFLLLRNSPAHNLLRPFFLRRVKDDVELGLASEEGAETVCAAVPAAGEALHVFGVWCVMVCNGVCVCEGVCISCVYLVCV